MNKVFKKYYLLSAFIICSFQADDSLITWTINRKLSWDDFQGKAVASNPADALTYTDIKTQARSDENGIVYVTVTNFFDKKLSWSKNKNSTALLSHEQLHFDITEYYTRVLRTKLNSIATAEAIKSGKFNKESSRILNDWQQFQQKYDKETNHGTISSKQKEWEDSVHSLLESN